MKPHFSSNYPWVQLAVLCSSNPPPSPAPAKLHRVILLNASHGGAVCYDQPRSVPARLVYGLQKLIQCSMSWSPARFRICEPAPAGKPVMETPEGARGIPPLLSGVK